MKLMKNALSRRQQGFDSPWGRQINQGVSLTASSFFWGGEGEIRQGFVVLDEFYFILFFFPFNSVTDCNIYEDCACKAHKASHKYIQNKDKNCEV